MEELLNKIAEGFSKKVCYGAITDDGFSYKIFNKDQLTKHRPFKSFSMDYLIVKTKDGKATKRAYYVGTVQDKVTQVDACFYQKVRAKRFEIIQKLVKGE